MARKILTFFYYNDIGPQHLYKDVGSIPLGLAKYCGWDATLAYVNFNGEIHDGYYEKYVNLLPIKKEKSAFCSLLYFLARNSHKYDVLNFYHLTRKHLFIILLIRCICPKTKIYVKTDMGRASLHCLHRGTLYNWFAHFLSCRNWLPDLCTVETLSYVEQLDQMPLYHKRIRYLPNGFWPDPAEEEGTGTVCPADKENIILTVGRLGTPPKNTEMLLSAFSRIPMDIRKDWKLYLVGTYTEEIRALGERLCERAPSLRNQIVWTGNISDKALLGQYYARAAVFCLPSRFEGSPLVLPEAMHHGCFPVLTDCCDAVIDLTDQGKYGKIIPNEDVEALIRELTDAMQRKAECVKNGFLAKDYIDQNFSWENIVKRLQGYLDDTNQKE